MTRRALWEELMNPAWACRNCGHRWYGYAQVVHCPCGAWMNQVVRVSFTPFEIVLWNPKGGKNEHRLLRI